MAATPAAVLATGDRTERGGAMEWVSRVPVSLDGVLHHRISCTSLGGRVYFHESFLWALLGICRNFSDGFLRVLFPEAVVVERNSPDFVRLSELRVPVSVLMSQKQVLMTAKGMTVVCEFLRDSADDIQQRRAIEWAVEALRNVEKYYEEMDDVTETQKKMMIASPIAAWSLLPSPMGFTTLMSPRSTVSPTPPLSHRGAPPVRFLNFDS